MPVRVLYIDHTSKIGGGEVALFNLVRYIDRDLVAPTVLLFEGGPLADRLQPICETHLLELDTTVSKASKDALGWRSLGRVKEVWLTLRHILQVARFARRSGIELIHTNSLKADIIGGLAGRLAGIPVVWHVRDRITSDYLPQSVVRLFRLMCRTIPQFVIANSKATLATIQLNGRRPATAIGSGVVLRTQDGSASSAPLQVSQGGGPRVALVGRISPWKGQDVFLRAANLVLQQHPKVTFEIIGSALFSEREYEQSLHELCRTLQIESSVRFVGFVENVPAHIAGIDIFVHASVTGEPFGQVIVEAMSEEKPVVATNGGGVPEIVLDGVTGILVPMGDPVRMAEAVIYLLDNPELAQAMGRRGRERVLESFTIQTTARRVEAVYREVLHRRLA